MMLVISEKNLGDFIEKLKEKFEVFSAQGGSASGGDVLPFKKYFFPPVQEIFTTKATKVKPLFHKGLTFVAGKPPKKFILFGLNLPQLEALTQLDEIMQKPNEDFFYFQKRKQAVVMGCVDAEIDAMPGGDIIFQKIGEGKYKVWAENAKSKKIIKENKEFFTESEERPVGKSVYLKTDTEGNLTETELPDWSQSMRKLLLDPELLANAVAWSHEHKIWDELAEKCLGCGICTYVCPLCHCFSIEDRIGLDDKCSRCRKWDSCVLPSFSRIAGGHSFRPTLKERYYNWFYHKFVRAYREFGKSQCVGCGACKRNCPAGINIQEVLKTILEDYKKVMSDV